MSMLDDIKAAETAAVTTKKNAQLQARSLLREAEDTANAKGAELIYAAREEAKATVAQSQSDAQRKSAIMVSQRSQEDNSAAAKARAHLPEAVKFIVERAMV